MPVDEPAPQERQQWLEGKKKPDEPLTAAELKQVAEAATRAVEIKIQLDSHLREVVKPLADQVRGQIEGAIQRSIGDLGRMNDVLRSAVRNVFRVHEITVPIANHLNTFVVPALDDWRKSVADQVRQVLESTERVKIQYLRTAGPENWSDLDGDEFGKLLRMAEAGIPVAWVPRPSILIKLLAVDFEHNNDALLEVLMMHEKEVLEDCSSVVAAAHTGPFSELVRFGDQAVDAFHSGFPLAAQALAASLLDTLLRAAVEKPSKSQYYKKVKDAINSADTIALLPWAVAHWPVLTALVNFDSDGPPLSKFNRHATAHAVGDIQYSRENGLISLMMASSMLREAHRTAMMLGFDKE